MHTTCMAGRKEARRERDEANISIVRTMHTSWCQSFVSSKEEEITNILRPQAFYFTYISSCSEDLGEDHPGQTVPTVVECGDGQLQHRVLVLYRAQVQQAAKEKQRGQTAPHCVRLATLEQEVLAVSLSHH